MKKSGSAAAATTAIIVVAGAALAAAAGAAYLYQARRDAVPDILARPGQTRPTSPEAEASNPIPPPEVRPDQPADRPLRSATVYRIASDGEYGDRLVPATVRIPAGSEAMAGALNAMAALKNSPLPRGARARSVTLDDQGVATVDFNGAFVSNFAGGDTQEALVLGALLGALARFEGVEQVQILVEGQKIESLGDHQTLTAPLPVRDNPLLSAAQNGGAGGGEE